MAAMAAAPVNASPATNAEICHFFFEPAVEASAEGGDASAAAAEAAPADGGARRGRKRAAGTPPVSANGRANRHRCRLCRNVYTQNASTGYTNLMTHLRIKHADWPELFRAQRLPAVGDEAGAPLLHALQPASHPASQPQPQAQRMTVGRKRGPVYCHFQDLPDGGEAGDDKKSKRVRCGYCGADVPQVSGRLKLHLAVSCAEAPAAVQAEYAAQVSASDAPRAAKRLKRASLGPVAAMAVPEDLKAAVLQAGAATSRSASSTPVKTTAVSVSVAAAAGRLVRDTGAASHAFEDKLTAALVSGRVPWSFLDNKQFQEALTLLAFPSGFESGPNAVEFPLTPARASTVVVKRLADEYDRKVASALGKAKFATIVVDRRPQAGPHARSERVKLIAVNELRRSFLLVSRVGSAATSAVDAAKFASGVLEACVRAQPFPEGAKLFLCSDATHGSFSHLRRLFNELDQQPAPVVDDGAARRNANSFALIGSCLAQQSALLLKDVLCETQTSGTLADAMAITMALRGLPEFARAPHVTDWASVAQTARAVVSHEHRVREAFADKASAAAIKSDAELSALSAVVRDETFWATLKAVDALLAPLNACAAMSELPSATSGQYLSLWAWTLALAMESPLLRDPAAKARLADRFFQRVHAYVEDHELVSLVLDPRVRGAGLSSSGLRRARGVAVRVASALIPSLDETSFVRSFNDYVKAQGDFGDDGLWNAANTSDPVQFWSDFDGDALHGQLARLALAVNAFVPHTRSVQSYWSAAVAPGGGDGSDDNSEDESSAQDKICFAVEDTDERRISGMVASYGALVGLQQPASGPGAASDGPAVRPIRAFPDLDQVMNALTDSLDQDVAVAATSLETAPSASAAKVDASWLDASAAGAAQAQTAASGFFATVGDAVARLSTELVV